MKLAFHECKSISTKMARLLSSMLQLTMDELGPHELKYLQLPKSTKQEVSMKMGVGISLDRILKGLEQQHTMHDYLLVLHVLMYVKMLVIDKTGMSLTIVGLEDNFLSKRDIKLEFMTSCV